MLEIEEKNEEKTPSFPHFSFASLQLLNGFRCKSGNRLNSLNRIAHLFHLAGVFEFFSGTAFGFALSFGMDNLALGIKYILFLT
jgi:hypothetical protein